MRPAHIHVVISAASYEMLITRIFPEGDAYPDSGAVFGVKNSLVAEFIRSEPDGDKLLTPLFVEQGVVS